MKILVTGGAGFIGHHFVEHLIKNTDWQIIVLDKLTYASSGLDRLRDILCFDTNRVTMMAADFINPILVILKEDGTYDLLKCDTIPTELILEVLESRIDYDKLR